MKFIDRLPTSPGRVKITLEDGSSYFATMERADDPTVEGTPLNAENLNRLASKSGAFEDGTTAHTKPVPADAAPYAEAVEIGGVTRKCANLIPFPYIGMNGEAFGTTYTINSDGTITFSGKTTSGFTVILCEKTLSAGSYYLSDNCSATGVNFVAYDIDADTALSFEGAFTLTKSTNVRVYYLMPVGFDGTAKTYPMLNEGSTALPYEPYFEGLRSASVSELVSEGVNIWDEEWELGGYVGNGVPKENTTCIRSKVEKYIKVTPNTVYYAKTNGSNMYVFQYDESYNYVSYVAVEANKPTFVTENRCRYIRFQMSATYGTTYKNDVCINKFDEAINGTYFPYFKRTLPIPAEVQALDGYGCGVSESVYNYIDWEKKQFVKRVGRVDLGTLAFELAAGIFRCVLPSDFAFTYGIPNLLCAKYETVFTGSAAVWAEYPDKVVGYRSDGRLMVKDGDYTDVATFKAAMSGVMLYYELAEPIITDISDLLPADNLIGVEGGGTVRMVSEYGYDVPNNITFYEDKNEVVGADTFVGDLQGTAKRAEVALDVPNWAKQPTKPTYTAAEIGAAPAGFGLGATTPESFDRANECIKSGWYLAKNDVPTAAWWLLRVTSYNNKNIYQEAFAIKTNSSIPNSIVASRVMENGTWKPWEYVNPPMELGFEYRTTERMNGKAVYKKLDSSGKLLMRLDGETEWKDYVYNATNAINAVNDGEGNNIATTYMTKSEAAILGRVATGTYVGREDLAQTVTIGFKPKFITAIGQINKDRFFYIAGDGTGTFHETDTGFTTGYSTEEYRHPTNYAGETYTYFAIG